MSFEEWRDTQAYGYKPDAQLAFEAGRAEAEAEMRALMACGHPKACLTMGPVLHFDKIDVLNVEKSTQCFVCAEIAALKAERDKLREALQWAMKIISDAKIHRRDPH